MMGSPKASQTVQYLGEYQNTEHGTSEQTKAHQNNRLNIEKHTLEHVFANVFVYVINSSSKNQYKWSALKILNIINPLENAN